VTDTSQQPRAPPAQAPSYAPEPPSSFVHDVESHHTHDELAVAQSMVELARPLRDIQALPAQGPPPHSPHAITGDQSTISPLGILSTPAQPIIMQPNNPGAMLPQDQITFMDRLFPHATWIQNPGGYSKVVEQMRRAKYRTLTQIGGGPFTKSNELAAVVRNKFVNGYRRAHGEAVFKENDGPDGNRYQAQNGWFNSLSLDGKTDYIHYAMRQLVGLLTVDEQRKIKSLKQGLAMSVGRGSGFGLTDIGLHTEIGTSRGNTNNRVTGGMGFMSSAAPGGPMHGGAANGMSLAQNPTSSAADIVRVRGSTAVSLRPLLPKARDTGSSTGNQGVQNRGSGDGLSGGNTVQQAVQTFSEGPTAAQRLVVRNTRNPSNPQRTPAIAQVPAAAPNVNSPTNDPVRCSIQAIRQELQTHRESRKQLDRKIEALENILAELL
jgi:hypothetical protein